MPGPRRKSQGGRPNHYTADRALSVILGVRAGLSLEDAARAAGTSRTVVFRWLQAARAGEPRFTTFLAAIEQAKADWRAERKRRARAEAASRLGQALGGRKVSVGTLFKTLFG